MKKLKKIIFIIIGVLVILFILSIRPTPETITYGVSFSKLHSEELNIDWKKTYTALLDDLGVRYFRLSAHWNATEPERDQYNWADLDYQIGEAEKRGAKAILAIGRRLPGWPECHEPLWYKGLSQEEKEAETLQYLTDVVNRYKDSPAIEYWQVENEFFLSLFATYHCGKTVDEDFLKKEIATVRAADPQRNIIVTDSGELGLWYKAYRNADIFATSLYLYIWNHQLGPIRYPVVPAFFDIKYNVVRLIYGAKPAFISELSAEPWLLQPIVDTPLETQLQHMNIERFNKIIEFGRKTKFDRQYLWGAEWWYWLKEKNNRPEFWDRAKEIF